MKNKFLATLFLACSISTVSAQTPVYMDDAQPIEARVKDALSRMTLEEKVALCHAQSKFSSAGVPRLGIPELWMSDGPHGVRAEINWNDWGYANWTNDSITAFPALTCLAATWNPDMSAKYGKAIGEEARYREKDVLLGPGVNIYRTPMNGRNFEYMGEDPYLASVMCVPYIQELQKNGVAACVKHYALNNQELWRGHIDVNLSDRALHEIYLPAFKAAVEEGGAWSIMGAYNKIRGQHACHNDFTLNKILKDDWKFDGCVITDWGGAHDTYEAAVNGLDIEMGSYTNGLTSESVFTYNDYYLANPYLQMLKDGKVPMSTIDDKASRILRLIFRTAMNRQKPYGSVATEEHYAAAREIGNEGIVLLKNAPVVKKGAPLLPIDAAKYQNILVVGDNAVRLLNQGGGSSELKVKDMVSPLDGLRAVYGDKVAYAKGYAAGRPMYGRADEIPQNVVDSLRAEAVEMAKKADLVVLVGGLNKNHFQDCEGGDRLEYGLPFGQDELIEALLGVNKNLVLVLLSGNAVEMPWVSRVPAIVQGWYLGSMGGKSLADILSGAVNPSGKLPFSFPAKLTDCGAHAFDELSYPGDSIKQEYKEDILVGYRWHDTKKVPALFPFGHGLSYTTFTYGKPVASAKAMAADGTLTLTVAVKNTGSVAGKEIVQLYIGDDKCSVLRPVKELKHFAKVALAPGEEKNVTFTLTPDDLKFYDEASAAWKYEPGKFKAYVCASSADVRGVVPFEMQ
ncbi:glycoside hydrolase family 3 C-terminal domain-containing protein [Bacteroides uniformis]|uniref:glycoside hydrolase family 3 C-terminal domain-containing protein n=1 Tax=Bacteroides uniformis TaxID=820 RepID=UPI000EEE622D|nr:glycoside hydrolase family 3 C-terminal domain-containing protein [Bacteroides uniformis]MDC1996261.1 glycoside hydrolase family 3 C-terminal domain-containing protein [Bacteroides uniformis]MDC2000019.1 glycoside hydrolase family 3 C-terminal domain-containing protein [Bacteroides uniformis]MDC2003711.1 glycoside hydrolase family 3 C-terminal domain-containing protein [Bacteroides uniformis]HCR01695.1 glycosyl hydrolase [Bacteroides uniformis]